MGSVVLPRLQLADSMRHSQVEPMRMRGGGKEKQHVSIVVIGHVDSGVIAGTYFWLCLLTGFCWVCSSLKRT